ncbi:MAG TPA: RNA polymerase factor sigma-54 [Bacillota bacterium]|nr:RNA polymerase factor sigma-54 [Candidatus Fermentithermobacillaceae bacterium]HOB30217.1 RNA polymerase factor sigma-54 [Bacillota bacterium]HOK64174.1 RNA polymerase factor sigma-54 [Bacillota bacterium]HOL11683.1 RNA polymerase factor sigma-54 [Bacillota bacterium]HOQ02811.1 RNA polymerase factor sigma-54 [Bacillota bacterium]
MEPGYSLELVQTQKLVLTPELRQAIMILQMNVEELAQLILQEIEENPLLDIADERREDVTLTPSIEEDHDEEWIAYFADSSDLGISQGVSKNTREWLGLSHQSVFLREGSVWDALMSQLALLDLSAEDLELAQFIVGNIDDNGYLRCSVSEISMTLSRSPAEVDSMIRTIQSLEPPGICGRDLRECLELQALSKGLGDLELSIIRGHLEDLAGARYSKIAREQQASLEDVLRARDAILELDPKPGASLSYSNTTYIVPDIVVKKIENDFIVILNDAALPAIRWNPYYKRLLLEGERETRDYLNNKAKRAYYLAKSIEQRRITISKVMGSILKRQKRFFAEGPEHLEPMTLNDIAEELGIHPSTVSRAVSGKYVETPFGLFPCKMLFSPGVGARGEEVSQYNIKKGIEEIVSQEDPRNPLTDDQIREVLSESGIDIARRTVAKYRSQLGIPASNRRKRL